MSPPIFNSSCMCLRVNATQPKSTRNVANFGHEFNSHVHEDQEGPLLLACNVARVKGRIKFGNCGGIG